MQVATVRNLQESYASHLDAVDLRDPQVVRREVEQLTWWHSIDLGGGLVTPGRGNYDARLRALRKRLPDLTGKTVLDVGAWDGLFSFEAERHGAAEVVAVDLARPQTFELARRVLGSKVRYLELDVTRAEPSEVGVYDVVLFMGVLYHVANPFDLVRRVAQMTGERLILETDSAHNGWRVPVAEFRGTRDAVNDENYGPNWWIPNLACVEAMLHTAGFAHVERVSVPPRPRSRLGPLGALTSRLRERPPDWGGRLLVHATR